MHHNPVQHALLDKTGAVEVMVLRKLRIPVMNRNVILSLLCLCTLSVQAEEKRQRPNVIFVLVDDLGISDLEPTNPDCRIKTPHLKTMASEGITFLDAHSSNAVCTPPRYGLLTERYNWRSRLARAYA